MSLAAQRVCHFTAYLEVSFLVHLTFAREWVYIQSFTVGFFLGGRVTLQLYLLRPSLSRSHSCGTSVYLLCTCVCVPAGAGLGLIASLSIQIIEGIQIIKASFQRILTLSAILFFTYTKGIYLYSHFLTPSFSLL